MVQLGFTHRILAAAKQLGLHTAIQTSGFLGHRAHEKFLSCLDLVMLDIKSSDPETYRKVTGRDLEPTLRFAERLAQIGKPVWVRFTLVPGLTDDPANVEGIARFVAPMKNRFINSARSSGRRWNLSTNTRTLHRLRRI